ncbi:TetR/AcrR family transcriptional regulator [Cellulomonas timonensis]|uniref:TetR/AcrR family transcriptional regulator n=1 Tax=Cellulomonas timonensis TaxID=1689271 RepID=UPI000B2C98B9|nr:TetR/AcrR family transcriptional regulator [Cellulomonas timonensis]
MTGRDDMGFKQAISDLQRTVDAEVEAALHVPTSLGRPRDHTRDAVILEAALDVLAEHGYDAMTIEMVAAAAKAGKATLYRRWPSKAHLVVDAVGTLANLTPDLAQLPDTGTLRGDLIALSRVADPQLDDRKCRIVAGLCSAFPREPELAAVVRERLLEPLKTLIWVLLDRAKARGEIPPDRDLGLLALTLPAMVLYNTVFLNAPLTADSGLAIIDQILLPAAGVGA